MMVKICGITRFEDAVAAAEAGAGAIGFNFYSRSPRYIDPERAREISSRLPASVLKAGVFVNQTPAEIIRLAAAAALDIVQLHGSETPEDCPAGLRVWKAFRVTPDWNAAQAERFEVEAVLLDGPAPGTGASWNWARVPLRHRIVLAGGLNVGNVKEAIGAVQPWGVDVCSGVESAPGVKDHNEMRRFVRSALSGDSL